MNFTKTQLRNYLVNRSFLQNKAKSIEEVINFYSCLQVDPISVVAKNHELILFNRVEGLKLGELDNYIYKDRKAFEFWMQLYSIIPIEAFPYLTARMHIKGSWQEDYYKTHKKEIDLTLDFIEKNGPTSSKDLLHIPKVKGIFSWTSTDSRTALLAYLWDTGKIMISHRSKNLKYYDLTERILPQKIQNIKISREESVKFTLKQNFKYLGIVRKAYLGRSGYALKKEVVAALDSLVKKGEAINIFIDGKKSSYFILNEQVKEIERLGGENLHNRINILPPLDPLVIDRRILKDIFDFEYTWEAYVPAVKRKFGYYGMPILYKGEFVGQIDIAKSKDPGYAEVSKKLEIKNIELNKKIDRKLLNREVKELEKFIFK